MMKAAIFEDVGRICIKEIPKPECPPDGLLIKVAYCGICGSDIRNFRNGLRGGIRNQIMGHEISGVVVEAAPGVQDYRVGDRVALAPDVSCGSCWYCRRGMVNLCQSHRMLGTHFPGGFAQYMAVPGEVIHHGFIEHVPSGLDMRHAAFAETCAAVIACQKRNGISFGDTVVIIGDGPVGCLHYEVAKARGASKVILLGRGKIELAKRFSPDYLINNRDPESATRKVLEITEGIGADVVILAVPNVAAQEQALQIVRKRGVIIIYGGVPKDDVFGKLDSNRIHYSEITVTGAFSYSATGLSDALQALSDGVISTDKYLSDTVSLDEVVKGIELMRSGKAMKVLVDPWKE